VELTGVVGRLLVGLEDPRPEQRNRTARLRAIGSPSLNCPQVSISSCRSGMPQGVRQMWHRVFTLLQSVRQAPHHLFNQSGDASAGDGTNWHVRPPGSSACFDSRNGGDGGDSEEANRRRLALLSQRLRRSENHPALSLDIIRADVSLYTF
jgi:hypothetical protein